MDRTGNVNGLFRIPVKSCCFICVEVQSALKLYEKKSEREQMGKFKNFWEFPLIFFVVAL